MIYSCLFHTQFGMDAAMNFTFSLGRSWYLVGCFMFKCHCSIIIHRVSDFFIAPSGWGRQSVLETLSLTISLLQFISSIIKADLIFLLFCESEFGLFYKFIGKANFDKIFWIWISAFKGMYGFLCSKLDIINLLLFKYIYWKTYTIKHAEFWTWIWG